MMQRQLPFQQVDVFTAVPFKGNPVAVVLDGVGISTEEMQAIANWTNLSETTFVCTPNAPEADYRLRIFTPHSELPFAGHPTIGSAYALLKHGLKPKSSGRLVQECGSGLVTIHLDGDQLLLTLPEPRVHSIPIEERSAIAAALGVSSPSVQACAKIDVGAVWLTLQLTDAEEVRLLRPSFDQLAALTPPGVAGVTVFGLMSGESDAYVEVRSFAPKEGIPEDPVCGSGNGCVAVLVRELGLTAEPGYVASQGGCVGRDGKVVVRYHEQGQILLGGRAVTCIEGIISV